MHSVQKQDYNVHMYVSGGSVRKGAWYSLGLQSYMELGYHAYFV